VAIGLGIYALGVWAVATEAYQPTLYPYEILSKKERHYANRRNNELK